MANIQQITRDYLLRARTEGVAETTAAAQRLGAATDTLATKTETVGKSTLSAAAALEKHQRALDLNYRAARQFESVQRDLNAAQMLGVAANDNLNIAFGTFAGQLTAVSRQGRELTDVFLRPMKNVVMESVIAWGLLKAGTIAARLGFETLGNTLSVTVPEMSKFSGSLLTNNIQLERLGLRGGQITGVLKKMGDDFVQIQPPMKQSISLTGQFSAVTGTLANQFGTLAPQVAQASSALMLLSAGGILGAIIVGFTAAAAAGKKFADSIIETGQSADFANISLIEFQRLQKALEMSGGLSEKSFASGTEAIAKNLFDAGRESNALEKYLKANNVEFEKGGKVTLGTVDAIKVMADLIKNATDGAQKLRVASAFGVSKEWVRAVEDGGDAIQNLIDKMPKVGSTIDSEMIQKAKEFDRQWNIAMDTTLTALKGWALEAGRFLNLKVKMDLPTQDQRDFQDIARAFKLMLNPAEFAKNNDEMGEILGRLANSSVAVVKGMATSITEQWEVMFGDKDGKIKAAMAARVEETRRMASDINAIFGANFNFDTAGSGGPPRKETKDPDKAINETRDALDRQVDAIKKRTATMIADTAAVGMGVAAQESYRVKAQLLEAQTRADIETVKLSTLSKADQAKAIEVLAEEAGNAALELAKMQLQSKIKFDQQTMFLPDSEKQIAAAVAPIYGNDVQAALASKEAADLRQIQRTKEMLDLGIQFGQDLARGLLDGKSGMDALAAAAENLSKKLMDMAVQNAIMGALSGNVVQMARAAAQAVAAFALDAFSDNNKKIKEHQKAQADLKAAQGERDAFAAMSRGDFTGSLQKDIDAAQQSLDKLMAMALKAKDWAAVAELTEQGDANILRLRENFLKSWNGMIAALESGLGAGSPLEQARDNVRKLTDDLKNFIADTSTAGGDVQRATEASKQYLLSLIGVREPLSDVATAILEINGTAHEVQQSLIDLGVAAGDAAAAVNEELNVALAELAASFVDDLAAEINAATGKGWINDFTQLFADLATKAADATALGLDQSQVTEWFVAKAQDLVSGLDLSAEAFDALIALFPELEGVVTNTTAAIVRSTEELAAASMSIADKMFALTNDTSTLEGQLAALQRERDAALLAEKAAGGELLLDLTEYYAAAELKIKEDWNKKIQEETERAEKERMDALNAASRTILDFITGHETGSDSSLSGKDRLAAAEDAYQKILALAQTGDLDAQSKITQYADAFEKAAKDYYGSSSGYQDIWNQIKTELLALPAVETSTDPIVNALLGVKAAVNDTTAAVEDTTAAVDTNTAYTQAMYDSTSAIEALTLSITNNTATQTDHLNVLQALASYQYDTLLSIDDAIFLLGRRFTVDYSVTFKDTFGTETASDDQYIASSTVSVLEALQKIIINTGATAYNTGWTAFHSAGRVEPVFGEGGWVGGNLHGAGGTRLEAERGEYVLTRAAAAALAPWMDSHISQGRLPDMTNVIPFPVAQGWGGGANDNAALLARIDRLTDEVASLKRELRYNSDVTAEGNNINRSGHAKTAGAIDEQTDGLKAEERQNRNNPRKAA